MGLISHDLQKMPLILLLRPMRIQFLLFYKQEVNPKTEKPCRHQKLVALIMLTVVVAGDTVGTGTCVIELKSLSFAGEGPWAYDLKE